MTRELADQRSVLRPPWKRKHRDEHRIRLRITNSTAWYGMLMHFLTHLC